jgi:hypothetical protein
MSERLENIQNAIEHASGCAAKHKESVVVVEGIGDQKIWEGVVEVFELEGHPRAKRAYGWQSGDRISTVLEIPPVDSPNTAVKVALAAETKKV